ncbi:MAG: flagellar motor stator protein MotA [Rhodospirillaceae bacterium]|nr:flagellar motor stator protein MotA [Rhodospirillaceae bacterium]MBT6405323.1 flagellar motor stator protein MotA [Rhodospirillaceae bacterium]MBT6537711.1 flagellar motor stator protein MotA [Rhodospirillaceae bacterium]
MLVIVGWVMVLGCVLGGYVAMGGKLAVLYQPFELVIIGGAGVGAYITSNPKHVLKTTGKGFKTALKGPANSKDDYLELLSMMYATFKLAKAKGNLALEQHIENPHDSELFSNFPVFSGNHHAVEFFCDYLRLVTLGTENPHELEALMDEELDVHHMEDEQTATAMQLLSDGFPALGIVAAVLGIIKTMGSITEPPEILGKLIGGALVGTFLGILLAYGFVGPLASAIKMAQDANSKYLVCLKAGILAHVAGNAPAVSVEFARKTLLSSVRPTFAELEEATENVPA